MVPYTYLLKHIPTSRVYYGCRYAEGCHPNEFWKSYKTSSKYVKQLIELIEEYGEDSFVYDEIRKTFSDEQKCREWEHKVLRRMKVINREDFINKTDNKSISKDCAMKGTINRIPSERFKTAVSLVGKSNKGRLRSDEFKQKVSKSLIGNINKLGKRESDLTKFKKVRLIWGNLPECWVKDK